MTPNTGSRPSSLADTDQVHVILEIRATDGTYSHHGERIWTVSNRAGAIQWGMDRVIRVKEWERV